MTAEVNCVTERKISDGNQDMYVQYFYNLVAMSCLFGSLAGLSLAIKNQGNLSDIGARLCVSPVYKLKSVMAGLLADMLVSFILNAAGLCYLMFVLKIDFGAPLLPLCGITLVSSSTGVALGFFVGSIGRLGEGAKTAILISVFMFCCFMSGLMVMNMRLLVDKYAPWFNRINPAALISDSFYSLNIYSTYGRLARNLITLAVIAVVCTVGGFFMTRRQKYASL
jgi:ABC-2 type transport system permease protein